MKEFLKIFKKKNFVTVMAFLFAFILTAASIAIPCFAAEGEGEGEGTQLELDFNTGEMFQWTNLMLSVFKPILYISLGVGLAFTIVGYLRSVF